MRAAAAHRADPPVAADRRREQRAQVAAVTPCFLPRLTNQPRPPLHRGRRRGRVALGARARPRRALRAPLGPACFTPAVSRSAGALSRSGSPRSPRPRSPRYGLAARRGPGRRGRPYLVYLRASSRRFERGPLSPRPRGYGAGVGDQPRALRRRQLAVDRGDVRLARGSMPPVRPRVGIGPSLIPACSSLPTPAAGRGPGEPDHKAAKGRDPASAPRHRLGRPVDRRQLLVCSDGG